MNVMTLGPVAIVTHDLHGHAQRPDVSAWWIFPSYRVIDEYGGHTLTHLSVIP
jgi:hypothetical protein